MCSEFDIEQAIALIVTQQIFDGSDWHTTVFDKRTRTKVGARSPWTAGRSMKNQDIVVLRKLISLQEQETAAAHY